MKSYLFFILLFLFSSPIKSSDLSKQFISSNFNHEVTQVIADFISGRKNGQIQSTQSWCKKKVTVSYTSESGLDETICFSPNLFTTSILQKQIIQIFSKEKFNTVYSDIATGKKEGTISWEYNPSNESGTGTIYQKKSCPNCCLFYYLR